MDEKEALIQLLNKDLSIAIPGEVSLDEVRRVLAVFVNDLINTDFQKLVFLLYRLDVSETKLRSLLQSQHNDAGVIIADLIIERQAEKIRSRKTTRRDLEIDEDEKW